MLLLLLLLLLELLVQLLLQLQVLLLLLELVLHLLVQRRTNARAPEMWPDARADPPRQPSDAAAAAAADIHGSFEGRGNTHQATCRAEAHFAPAAAHHHAPLCGPNRRVLLNDAPRHGRGVAVDVLLLRVHVLPRAAQLGQGAQVISGVVHARRCHRF